MKINQDDYIPRPLHLITRLGILSIFVFLPFHAFLTAWLGSLISNLDLLRSWKEILLATVIISEVIIIYKYKIDVKVLFKDRLIRFLIIFITFASLMTIYGVINKNVDMMTGLYGLAQLTRHFLFYIAITISLLIGISFTEIKKLIIYPAIVVIGFGLLQLLILPDDFLKHFGYGIGRITLYQTVDSKEALVRVQSTLLGPNPLGVYLAFVGSIIFILLADKSVKKQKYLAVLGLLLITVLIGSFSRTGFVVLATSLFLITVLMCRTVKAKKYLAGSLFTIALITSVIFFSLRHNDTFQNLVFHTNEKSTSVWSTNEQRIDSLNQSLKEVKEEPFGRGVGTAGPTSFRNKLASPRIAENYYIQLIQEIGVVGLIIFIVILALAAKELFSLRENNYAKAVLGTLGGLTVAGMFSHLWADDTVSYLFWGTMAIVVFQNSRVIVRTKSENIAKL